MRRLRSGFTLVEMITVIVVIALLAVLTVSATQRMLAQGKVTQCLAHLKQLGIGLQGYLAENNNTIPELAGGRLRRDEPVPVIDVALAPYISDSRIFACPADTRIAQESGTSYYWNVTLNGQVAGSLNFLRITQQTSQIPLLADKEGFHPYLDDKVNILYADGHATKELNFRTELLQK